ncbi:hypothetical protein [Nocardioides sp.]|uniref:hypothetical protein n=1 Tax=Nocardioides sp. TaxID=35761 RepID=UPI0026078561|nr:hypothetical protein [Nocardioides sp.]
MRRPFLRPGFEVLRRDDHHLQVGLEHPTRVVLPDHPAVRRLLHDLTDGTLSVVPAEEPAAAQALTRLRTAGLLLEAPARHDERHQASAYGPDWPRRSQARAAAGVAVSGPDDLSRALAALLHADGIGTCSTDATVPDPLHTAAGVGVTVVMVAGVVPRESLDQVATPTLPVSFAEGRSEIGPFLVPGHSPCLRCADAARRDLDPRWPLLVEQAAHREAMSPPLPLVLPHLALALIARDVLAWIDGETPATWGATVTIDRRGLPSRTPWAQHPACGCSWATQLLADGA